MSKFRFTPDEDGDFGIEYSPTDDNFNGWLRHISGEDLADLATAAQAALAEQNSGVMGETACKCGITLYPVCDSYVQCPCGCDQCINSKCLHDKACHQPQAQRREA